MDKINMLFHTKDYIEGYLLGIDINFYQSLAQDQYELLCSKINFVFKNFRYGMDIEKMLETLKTILTHVGMKEEDVKSIDICLVNKRGEEQKEDISFVYNGSLYNDIVDYGLSRDREIIRLVLDNWKLKHYSYTNEASQFIYENNNIKFILNMLSDNPNKRNSYLNTFFKKHKEILRKIEKVDIPSEYSSLNINDSILLTAYQLFYDEMPDFNDPNLMTKFQCMTALLHVNVWRMFPYVSKFNYHDKKLSKPESEYVRDQLFKLNLLLDGDFSIVEKFNFNKHIAKKIEVMGNSIRDYLSLLPEGEKFEFLNQFTVDYLNTYYSGKKNTNENSQELMLILTKKDAKN